MSVVSLPRRDHPSDAAHPANVLRLRRLRIDTYQEPVIYMNVSCPVCVSEGWRAQSRIIVSLGAQSIIATLNVVHDGLLNEDEASLSEVAWQLLGAFEGATVTLSHPQPLRSMSRVRAKLYGERLSDSDFAEIIGDIVAGRYSAIELTAFVAACTGARLDIAEIHALTRAMIDSGERLAWKSGIVLDKHSVGGLPGNRTTMLVVPIVAAAGLLIPKTSSRAITSPAGTADAMETVAPVALDIAAIRRVVDREGGCIAWGGAVQLSPADDAIIRVERPLDLDGEGQLVASVLSKKAAAGSTHVVIDMPIGPTAKVRTLQDGRRLASLLSIVGSGLGLTVDVSTGDGQQPIGVGIGPALEARDVLAVLRGDGNAPPDLRNRAVTLAGRLIEMGRGLPHGSGADVARELLASGAALRKFEAICAAQGGMREPPIAPHTRDIEADHAGTLRSIDNRRLARAAKLAGAPGSPAAGLEVLVRLGARIQSGQPLMRLHANATGELEYALRYLRENMDLFVVTEEP